MEAVKKLLGEKEQDNHNGPNAVVKPFTAFRHRPVGEQLEWHGIRQRSNFHGLLQQQVRTALVGTNP